MEFSRLVALGVFCAGSCGAFSSSAFATGIEDKVAAKMVEQVNPFFAMGVSGTINGFEGEPVNYRFFEAAQRKGVIVLVPGFTETPLKYKEIAFDFHSVGYSVFIIEPRGQGDSPTKVQPWRDCAGANLVWNDPWASFQIFPEFNLKLSDAGSTVCIADTVHVKSFDAYVADLDAFVNEIVRPRAYGVPRFLLGHSMGAAIATKYVSEHPGYFQAMAATSPMYEIQAGPFSANDIAGMVQAIFAAYELDSYIHQLPPGSALARPYDPAADNFAFTDFADDGVLDGANNYTHSEVRFNEAAADRMANPASVTARPSLTWLREVVQAGRVIETYASTGKFNTPTLILKAAEERVVNAGKIDAICAMNPSCSLHVMDGARHEIMMEVQGIRTPALNHILNFFKHQGKFFEEE